jgi:tungstate transport system ATP-binding protein
MRVLLELREIEVNVNGRRILRVPRLLVLESELLAVIGPNGAGKSTLLRVMGLLESPANGTLALRGKPVDRRELIALRRRMATVFQEPLLCDTTVFENVALGLRFRRASAGAIASRVEFWLDQFGISHLARRQARTLSGGEAQRTALARALVLEPELLLLDEPFSSLDQPTRETLLEELGMILRRDRVTAVFVTHDRAEAVALADRVAVMLEGEILQLDETARLFRTPVSQDVARFTGVESIVDGRVVAERDGLAVVEADGQKLEVAAQVAPGERVRLRLRPEDITLMSPATVSTGGSARNHLDGRVARLMPAGPQVRVVVDCGISLVVSVTHRSVDELGLREGVPVVATFKATAPRVIRQGRAEARP